MSDSEDEGPGPSGLCSDSSSDEGPSTSWGVKRRNKRPVISDSENDDDDDAGEEIVKDEGESGDSDSSDDTPGARTCAICLGRMRGEVGSPDACEHTFCKFCLLEWAKNNPTCPQDRIPFTVVVVRKTLGGPIDKEVPVPKAKGPDVYEFTEAENPTYCEVCNQCNREDRLLLCDGCDLGYHLECLDPALSQVPVEEWFCPVCVAVEVPNSLSSRGEPSSARSYRSRSRSSRPSGASHAPQEPRIPRTRATERIRARIQRKKNKKKLRRRKYRETKKAKIESGELEDTRPPVTKFSELKHFVEGDNDVDAAHAEDRFAEQLLAGTTQEDVRLPSQRKADAARRLRDVAFTPQASYSGRVKNKVIEIVKTQNEDTDNDLLSGILENQTIAFSSSKKLLLTNDRKLTKQPNVHIPCDIFAEHNSIMSEPLPSQIKTPERCNGDSSDPSEKSSTDPSKEVVKEESDEGGHPSTVEDGNKSANYRDDRKREYSHGVHYADKYGHHSRTRDGHHHSKYSAHDRHSSSWRKKSPYEPSSSSHPNDDRSRWNKDRDHRGYSSRHEKHGKNHSRDRSPHNRNRSPDRDSRKNSKGSPSSSKHNRSRDHRSHSSRSHKSHSRSKGESSRSREGYVRSQWSFNYFNASDNVISKNNSSSNLISSSAQDESKLKDVGGSGSEISSTESISQETSLKNTVREGSNCNEIEPVKQEDLYHGNNLPGVSDSGGAHSQEHPISTNKDNSVQRHKCIPDSDDKPVVLAKPDRKDGELSSHRDERVNGRMSMPDEKIDCFDPQGQHTSSSQKHSITKDESKNSGKSLSKSSVLKKSKISALFGDLEDDEKDEVRRKESDEDPDRQKENEDRVTKSSKLPKKCKSEMLFGYDSEDNSTPKTSPRPEAEISGCQNDKSLLKDKCEKIPSSNLHIDLKNDSVGGSKEDEYVPLNKSSKGMHRKTNHGGEKVFSSQSLTKTESIFKNETEIKSYGKHDDEKIISHEKHHVKEKPTKFHEKHNSKDNETKPQEKHNIKDKDKESKSQGRHDTKEKESMSYEKHRDKGKETKSHEKRDTEEKRAKSPEQHDNLKNVLKCREKADNSKNSSSSHEKNDNSLSISKSHGKHDTKENIMKRTQGKPDALKNSNKHTADEEITKFVDVQNSKNTSVLKADNSKNNGQGKKSSSKISSCYNGKIEEKQDIFSTSTSKEYENRHDIVSEHTETKEVESEKNRKSDSKNKSKGKHVSSQEERRKKSSAFIDLFGDIDDVGSSSCSNIPEPEPEPEPEEQQSNKKVKDAKRCEPRLTSFEGKIINPKDPHEKSITAECSNTSAWILDTGHVDTQNEADNKELGSFGHDPTPKHKQSLGTKQDNDRTKQQKALLEHRVVQEVKKSLDPYYRNKSITKDEYKQIVAKCVKKVVTAECGDVIEPGKMQSLVMGYIKVYKHRQMKSHT